VFIGSGYVEIVVVQHAGSFVAFFGLLVLVEAPITNPQAAVVVHLGLSSIRNWLKEN
jgi:hypothetical protein